MEHFNTLNNVGHQMFATPLLCMCQTTHCHSFFNSNVMFRSSNLHHKANIPIFMPNEANVQLPKKQKMVTRIKHLQ
jgi:hypothetical protein